MKNIIVQAFLTADYIFPGENGKTGIIGIFDNFTFETFPSTVPQWYIYAQFTGIDKPAKAQFFMADEKKEIVFESKVFSFEKEKIAQKPRIDFVMPMINFPFTKPGAYTISLQINDEAIASKQLTVIDSRKKGV